MLCFSIKRRAEIHYSPGAILLLIITQCNGGIKKGPKAPFSAVAKYYLAEQSFETVPVPDLHRLCAVEIA